MKTFRTIMITFVVTVLVGASVVFGFLLNEGIVTIEKRDTNHTKTVMIDGVVTEEHNWNEVLGYGINIDVVDGVYIGK